MIVGCYSLHLYCDNEDVEHPYDEFPHTYTAELGSKCRNAARRDGWRLGRTGKAYCPLCGGKPK
jgi:hypothetical protein